MNECKPRKKLSYQLNHHRIEHWILGRGIAKVKVDNEEKLVRAGENIFFREEQKHRLENPGNTPLEIIGVKMGVSTLRKITSLDLMMSLVESKVVIMD
jgi:mannose-6-phosphate isomerase-like protein (cupin superfamily)